MKPSIENPSEKPVVPEEDKVLDQEFIDCMLEIEKKYVAFKKHDKIRIEQWTKKLCQVTTNVIWKKNRNLYSKLLLSNVLNKSLGEPFTRGPPEGALPKLNKAEISSKLGRPMKTIEISGNPEEGTPDKRLPKTQTIGYSPDMSEDSSKKPENTKKLCFSSNNFVEEAHKDSAKLQGELELLRLSEKELREELRLKSEENEVLRKQIQEKDESEKHLKADINDMQSVLEKIQTFFGTFEKRIDKMGNFKSLHKELEEVLATEKKEARVFESEKLDAQRSDFDNFLADAYCETSKFLEKLEEFQKKTEVLKKEVEEKVKGTSE